MSVGYQEDFVVVEEKEEDETLSDYSNLSGYVIWAIIG